MTSTFRALTILLVISLGWATVVQAAETTRHNPFKRSATTQPTSNASAASGATINYRVTHPRLRAVLQATDGSLANLDGHILAQGESALGYTLIAVQDHSAKFRFRHQLITLQVTEDRP